jgi:micrococcal nuclease
VALAKKILFSSLILLLLSSLLVFAQSNFSTDTNKSLKHGTKAENGARRVIRVIDGDTLVLSPNEKIRLIGVDTPETKHPKRSVECFGQEAREFTKRMVAGKRIRLELDQTNSALGHKDKYGRTLGYVYLENGTFLNAEIVRQGYGHAYTQFPFRYLEEFRVLQRQARERGLGLWSSCRGSF